MVGECRKAHPHREAAKRQRGGLRKARPVKGDPSEVTAKEGDRYAVTE